jgi:hypothetical protein
MKKLKLFEEFVQSDINRNTEIRITPEMIESLKPNEIFVFGSNLQGVHTKGAARFAVNKGWADDRQVEGLSRSGQSFAIPTQSDRKALSITEIETYVKEFIDYVKINPDKVFYVTPLGTGIAGISNEDIAPLFNELFYSENVFLPQKYYDILLTLNARET